MKHWRIEQVRQQGGTTYRSAGALFQALQECFDEHEGRILDLEDGDDLEVMQFFGAYSIVMQPRVGPQARAQEMEERMREIGFR